VVELTMGFVRVVNMIPSSLSGETNQDSEPNLAVNPQRPTDMVATAFTPSPGGGNLAPIYVSTDGGSSWSLRNVVPGGGGVTGTFDITVGFATTGGVLYAGSLVQGTFQMQIMRTATFSGVTPMVVLVNRTPEDQPWVVAGSVVVNNRSVDRVYVGSCDSTPRPAVGKVAAIDVSQDAAIAPAPANFLETALGLRRGPFSLPPTRIALHPDGTVYAAFLHVTRLLTDTANQDFELVVRRDDNWGSGANSFSALAEPGQITPGVRVVGSSLTRFQATVAALGQERIGADLAIAVDPNNSSVVFVAWCERTGGITGTDWQLNVARSTDRGQNWTPIKQIGPTAKNPALAVNAKSQLGLAYQQLTGNQWITRLEVTRDGWATAAEVKVLHQANGNAPVRNFFPYIGDYIRLLSIDNDFYGVFSGSNMPDLANFPNGVTYQRLANFQTKVLLNTNGVTPVAVSIDPFFFHWSLIKTDESKQGITKAEIDTPPKNVKTETKEIAETKTSFTKAEIDTPSKTIKAETKELVETKTSVTKAELDVHKVLEHGPSPSGGIDPEPLLSLIQKLSQRVDSLESQAAQGRAFIRPVERPDVGVTDEEPGEDE
jgi:hypothetical protein